MKNLLILIVLICMLSVSYSADFKLNGVYTAWAQSQHDFWFENTNRPTYNDNYVVQMLRFNLQGIASENLKFVTRIDIAQGWWGVDNALRSVQRTGTGGGSALFDFKDTNFLVHVDQAFVDFKIPRTPLGARIGRIGYGLGNKIMVDNNYEGIQIDLNKVVGEKVMLSWARVSEGVDGTSDEEKVAPDQRGYTDARDADLLTLDFSNKAGNFQYNVYGLYYTDRSTADSNAYVPDHLQYFRARFSPQITQLTALGLAANYKKDKLSVKGEVDYLMGKDDINNTTYGGQMWDINDGDLSGFNIYLNLNYAAADKLDLGAVFGMGSGDDDPTKGKGNVNKLRTAGFFYITEIWEDSIMPDEEGITPQGLGAPNVRGYRELENTTIFQINGTWKPFPSFSAFVSYNYIQATQNVYAWDAQNNPDLSRSAKDLGQEIDFRFTYDMYKELQFAFRGGYFMPGAAAGYLINGTDTFDSPAWELKGMVTFKF
ncbi:MAG: hypothetical protein EH225_10450 [Calditrichaeota bacterium]|nr:alginate export family protein [Calditrichota bacterium]RQV92724.1 MAG: hypothetical protein EH221_10930 [bacterium]RQW00448.1 MAG: hypothetical protein EH225_10450 [Calditrichota bacterium]